MTTGIVTVDDSLGPVVSTILPDFWGLLSDFISADMLSSPILTKFNYFNTTLTN